MAAITICSDIGAPKIKFDTVSPVSPSISHEVMEPETDTYQIVIALIQSNHPVPDIFKN